MSLEIRAAVEVNDDNSRRDMRDILEPILTETLAGISEQTYDAVNNLCLKLAEHHDTAKRLGTVAEFKSVCQEHLIFKIILECPYVRRAFEKPRGYAGDAIMLDFIYKPGPVNASLLGAAIHTATTGLPNAQSIIWRRNYLAGKIASVMEGKPTARVLSVASGHMRELEVLAAMTEKRNVEIWALDQDAASVEECLRSYPDFNIVPLNKSVSFLLRMQPREKFDLIYSAGLADYLQDKTLIALLRALDGHLSPGGLITVGNFAPDSHGRGFMEGFMDWSLIYRDETDLIRLAKSALPGASYQTFRDDPDNVAYIEIRT
jgi:extracellular factor (EF) 3-hydroxypalmitic acid methyl ester biosynthesis protein